MPNFPDPPASGPIRLPVDLSSPAFEAAQAKCQKLMPGGGPPRPGSTTHPSAQALTQMLKVSQCMRRRGISEFPDPGSSVVQHGRHPRGHRHARSDPGVPVHARHVVSGIRAGGGRVQFRDGTARAGLGAGRLGGPGRSPVFFRVTVDLMMSVGLDGSAEGIALPNLGDVLARSRSSLV